MRNSDVIAPETDENPPIAFEQNEETPVFSRVAQPTQRSCSGCLTRYCAIPVSHAFRSSRPHFIESL